MDWFYSLSGFLVRPDRRRDRRRRRLADAARSSLVFASLGHRGRTDLLLPHDQKPAARGRTPARQVAWTWSAGSPRQRTGFPLTLVLLHLSCPDPGKLSAIVSVALGFALILTAGALCSGKASRLGGAPRCVPPALASTRRNAQSRSRDPRKSSVTVSSVGAGCAGVTVLFLL